MIRYKNYTELAAAFKSGELDPKKYYLMIDKGGCENYLSRHYDGDLSEEENKRLQEECSKWFDGDRDITELLDALGIPNEWC